MSELVLVTGSVEKLASWRRLVPGWVQLSAVELNQVEIQPVNPMDSYAIVSGKARRAYERVGKPVVVEDVSAGLACLNGFPGPYIKAAEYAMGDEALWLLAGKQEGQAYVECHAAYFDGRTELVSTGRQEGNVVAPRTPGGWGFDRVFFAGWAGAHLCANDSSREG